MVEQAKQIAKGLWEANQELAEEIAHEIYELRDEPEKINWKEVLECAKSLVTPVAFKKENRDD